MRVLASLWVVITLALVSIAGAKELEESDTLARWMETDKSDQEAFAYRFVVAARAYNGPELPVSDFVNCFNEFARVRSMHTHRIVEIGGLCLAKALSKR